MKEFLPPESDKIIVVKKATKCRNLLIKRDGSGIFKEKWDVTPEIIEQILKEEE